MISRIRTFLGPTRVRTLFLLLALTGTINLILNAFVDQVEWARPAQTALVLVFIVGAAIIVGGKLTPHERGRWVAILVPAFGLVLIGVLLLPHLLLLMMGLAFGWIVAGLFIFKARGPMQYQQAVKHMRKNQYAEAVEALDMLIKEEPDNPNHYRFRAEILRLWGKLDRARRDYCKMVELAPDSAVAHNGLAEVELQAGHYESARESALTAYDLAQDEWVAAYNLGMIEDRLDDAEAAVEHLNTALKARVPDVRHRLLIHFYLARAYARLGDMESAHEAVAAIKQQRKGLTEWRTILESDQADTLRAVLETDINTAAALANDAMTVEELAEE